MNNFLLQRKRLFPKDGSSFFRWLHPKLLNSSIHLGPQPPFILALTPSLFEILIHVLITSCLDCNFSFTFFLYLGFQTSEGGSFLLYSRLPSWKGKGKEAHCDCTYSTNSNSKTRPTVLFHSLFTLCLCIFMQEDTMALAVPPSLQRWESEMPAVGA